MLTLMSCGQLCNIAVSPVKGQAHGRIGTMDPWCIPGIGLLKASATRSLALRHMLNV